MARLGQVEVYVNAEDVLDALGEADILKYLGRNTETASILDHSTLALLEEYVLKGQRTAALAIIEGWRTNLTVTDAARDKAYQVSMASRAK